MHKIYVVAMLAGLILALNACGKKEEAPKIPAPTSAPAPVPAPSTAGVTVLSINLGNAIGADKKVTQAGDSFGKKDTLYASVDTTGSGTAKLTAKWTFKKDDKQIPVKEETQTITPSGPVIPSAANIEHSTACDATMALALALELASCPVRTTASVLPCVADSAAAWASCSAFNSINRPAIKGAANADAVV